MSLGSRSDINMSKSDCSVRSDMIVSDEISVLRITMISVSSRSDINGVKSGISIKNCVDVSV